MNDNEFNKVIEEALDGLPDEFRSSLKNIEIVVEERPSSEIARWRGKNCLLLGLYQGVPLNKRGHYYAGVLPDKISIYKEAILKISSDHNDAVENIKKTLLHELGHYFGISDRRLRELGY